MGFFFPGNDFVKESGLGPPKRIDCMRICDPCVCSSTGVSLVPQVCFPSFSDEVSRS